MKKPIDPKALHSILGNLMQHDLDDTLSSFMKKHGYPARNRQKVFDALALLEKEKIGGIHALLARICNKKDLLRALEKEMLDSVETHYEKVWAKYSFDKTAKLLEDEYFLEDWRALREKWDFLFVPDVFYPGKMTEENIGKWTNAFVKYFLKYGIEGVVRLYKDIGNFLAGHDIDCAYNGIPIYYYSLVHQIETKFDKYGRLIKSFNYPMRYTVKEILHGTDSFNRLIESRMYGPNLELKQLGVFYKYSWGMKPHHKKDPKNITHQLSWTEMFLHRERNRIVRDRFKELKKRGYSNNKCYDIIGKQISKSPTTVRQIVKRREKLA